MPVTLDDRLKKLDASTQKSPSMTSNESVYGYKVRPPVQGEDEYFKANPDVAGMAGDDGQITLNPYSKNTPEQQQAVAKNEAARIFMEQNKYEAPPVTKAQRDFFKGTDYEKPENDKYLRQTIIARIISGDASAGDVTPEQRKAADAIQKDLAKRDVSLDDRLERLLGPSGLLTEKASPSSMPTEQQLYEQELQKQLQERSGGMMDYLPGPVKDVASAAAGYASDMAGVGLRGSAAAENLVRGLIPDKLEGAAGFALKAALPGVGHAVTAMGSEEMSRKKLDLANDLQKTSEAFDEAVNKARGDGTIGWARRMGSGALRSGANMVTGSLLGGVPGALALAGATEASQKYGELEMAGKSEAEQLGWATAAGVWESTIGYLINKVLPGNEKLISDALKGEMKKLWKKPLKEAAKEVFKEQRNAQVDEQITELGHLGMRYADGTTQYVSPEETMKEIFRTMRDTAMQTFLMTGGVQAGTQAAARAAEKRDGASPFWEEPPVPPQTPPAAPVTPQTPPPRHSATVTSTTPPPRPAPQDQIASLESRVKELGRATKAASDAGDTETAQRLAAEAGQVIDEIGRLEKASRSGRKPAPRPIPREELEAIRAKRAKGYSVSVPEGEELGLTPEQMKNRESRNAAVDELIQQEQQNAAAVPQDQSVPEEAGQVGQGSQVDRGGQVRPGGQVEGGAKPAGEVTPAQEVQVAPKAESTYSEMKARTDAARARGDLTMKEVNKGTEEYRGKGGISAETKGSGFQAAFRDKETGEFAVPMIEATPGKLTPVGVHVFDGLPDSFVTERNKHGEPIALKGTVEAGFIKDGKFYTRDEAAEAVSKPTPPAPTPVEAPQTDIQRAMEEEVRKALAPKPVKEQGRKPSKEAEALAERAAKGEQVERPTDVSEARWKAMVAQKAKRLGKKAPEAKVEAPKPPKRAPRKPKVQTVSQAVEAIASRPEQEVRGTVEEAPADRGTYAAELFDLWGMGALRDQIKAAKGAKKKQLQKQYDTLDKQRQEEVEKRFAETQATPKKPARKPSAETKAKKAALDKAAKEFRDAAKTELGGTLPGAVNPRLVKAAGSLIKAAVEYKYSQFKDFVDYVVKLVGEKKTVQLADYLEAAWAALRTNEGFTHLDEPSSIKDLLKKPVKKAAPKAEPKTTPLGKPVVGREGAVYRAFDEPEDAAPQDRGVSFNRDQPFGYGGGYEIEVIRPKGEEVQHHPGHEMGILNPNDVTRLFYEPGYFNENAHDAIVEDLQKLRRMFPKAEFVRVEMDLESPDEARIAVPHGEYADAVKPVPAKTAPKAAPAPKSNWQDSVLSALSGKTKVADAVTLPDLWAQIEKANPGMTMEEFKKGLLKLHTDGKIRLEDATGEWATIINNPLAIRGKDFDEKRGYGLKWWVRGVTPVESPVRNPVPPPVKEVPPVDPEKTTSTKNRKTDELRDEIGMPQREKPDRETFDEWEQEAAKRIAKDPNYAPDLVQRLMDKPFPPDKVENAALGQHIQALVNRRNAGEDVLDELSDAIMASTMGGSEAGRALGSRRAERLADFSLAGLIQNHIDRVGEAPNKEMMAKLEEMAKRIEQLDAEVAELRQRKTDEEIDALIEEAKKQAQKPAPKEKIGTKKERIKRQISEGVSAFKTAWNEAVKAAGSKSFLSGVPLTPETIAALGRAAKAAAGLIKSYAELGVESFIELTARIKQDIGDITAEQTKIFREEWDKLFANVESPIGPTPTDPMIGATARQLTRYAVEAGITDREQVIDVVHQQLTDWGVEQTRSETMRAMSGYGDFRELPGDIVSTTVRGIKGEIQQLLKLEAMQAGQAPEKTGVERREPTEAERQLIKDVNEAKKKGGYTVTDPKRQLKSALDTAKTTVENALKDTDLAIEALQKAIADRVPLAKPEGRTPGPTDAKLEEMKAKLAEKRAQRKALRAEYDTIFPPKRGAMSDANRLKMAERLLTRLNDQLEADLAAGNIMGKEQKNPLTSPILEEQRSRREELKAALAAAREGSPEYQAQLQAKEDARYLKDLQRQEAFWNKRAEDAKRGVLPTPKPKKTRTNKEIVDKLIERDKAKRKALAEIEAEKRRRWDLGQKFYAGLSEVATALPRELMAGLENSVVLRQGWFFTMQAPFHPVIVFSRILDGLQSMFSERIAAASQENLTQRPNYKEYGIADIADDPLGPKDELYQSRIVDWLASTENILWFPARWAAKAYIGTARGFRTFSNGMKADLYDLLKHDTMQARRFFNKYGNAKVPEWTESDTKLTGRSANIFAGRGTGLKEGGILNYLLWAPKWAWSRIQAEFLLPLQMASPKFLSRWNSDPAIRIAHARLYVQALVGAATHLAALYFTLALLAGDDEEKKPKIEFDTTSTDLWKLQIGDTRIDVMGGLQQYLVFFSRLWHGTKKLPSGEVVALRGEEANPFKGDMWDEITKQARYKFGPTFSGIIDFITQKTAVGEQLPDNVFKRTGSIVARRLVPMTWPDIFQAEKSLGLKQGTVAAIEAFMGASVNTYGDYTKYRDGTEEERADQFDKALNKLKWDSPDLPYMDLLTKDQKEQVSNRKDLVRGELIMDAMADPPEPGKVKDVATLGKAVESLQKRQEAFQAKRESFAALKAQVSLEEAERLLAVRYAETMKNPQLTAPGAKDENGNVITDSWIPSQSKSGNADFKIRRDRLRKAYQGK